VCGRARGVRWLVPRGPLHVHVVAMAVTVVLGACSFLWPRLLGQHQRTASRTHNGGRPAQLARGLQTAAWCTSGAVTLQSLTKCAPR
jgi:hypothetical protein